MRLIELLPPSHRQLQERRFNARLHIAKIMALSEVYGPDKVARAIEDAFEFAAFSSDYIANILEQRERLAPPPGPLHLTRRQDLLDVELAPADLSLYEPKDPTWNHLHNMIKDPLDTVLQKQLDYLKLPYCQENFRSLAAEANTQHWTHLDYLARLVEGEAAARQDRAVLRRVKAAPFSSH